jgi:hypothetical protein
MSCPPPGYDPIQSQDDPRVDDAIFTLQSAYGGYEREHDRRQVAVNSILEDVYDGVQKIVSRNKDPVTALSAICWDEAVGWQGNITFLQEVSTCYHLLRRETDDLRNVLHPAVATITHLLTPPKKR